MCIRDSDYADADFDSEEYAACARTRSTLANAIAGAIHWPTHVRMAVSYTHLDV